MSSFARTQPRFLDEHAVDIEFESRSALHEAWTVDISKGGMFLRTDAPPPFGTRLTIKFTTPGGVLDLEAEVVHVVDAASAAAFNQPPGVGVQFVDLSDDVRKRIEAYVDGVAQRLSEELAEDKSYEPLHVLLADARRIMDALQASRIYAALEVDPGATRDEIELRVQTLCERFSAPPPDSPPPRVARLEQVVRQIERLSELVANPLRRLHYDFHHGHVRAEERRAASEDIEYLAQVWAQAFPERVERAKQLAERALAIEDVSLEECAKLAEEARANDPFNEDLRVAHERWSSGDKVGGSAVASAGAESEIDAIVADLRAFAAAEEPNHYDLLGVARDASPDDVTKAYFAKSRRFHPDGLHHRVDEATLRIAIDLQAKLNAAYRTLHHPAAREAYRRKLEHVPPEVMKAGEALMAFEMAKVHLRKGSPELARPLLASAHASEPDNAAYAAFYAWSMLVDRDFDRKTALEEGQKLLEAAIATARAAKAKDPILIGQWTYYLGCLFRERGDAREAIRAFDVALSLNPHLKEASMERRVLKMRQDNPTGGR